MVGETNNTATTYIEEIGLLIPEDRKEDMAVFSGGRTMTPEATAAGKRLKRMMRVICGLSLMALWPWISSSLSSSNYENTDAWSVTKNATTTIPPPNFALSISHPQNDNDDTINRQNASQQDHDNIGGTAAATVQIQEPPNEKKIRLFHVMNIYATNNKDNDEDSIHQPYDQWVTLQSIERAKQNMPTDLQMTLICAIFPSDWELLSEATVCDHRVLLERSTRTEYGGIPNPFTMDNFQKPEQTPADSVAATTISPAITRLFADYELPFMQDILDAAVSVAKETETKTDFYVMMTNADIGLTKDFYPFLLEKLKEGREAFQINRAGVKMVARKTSIISILEPTKNQAKIERLFAQIDRALENRAKWQKHPGTDCFLLHSSVIDRVHLGNQFAGYPAWARYLKLVLERSIARDTYEIIPSSPNGTFHLGNDRNWEKGNGSENNSTKADPMLNFVMETYRNEIAACPKDNPIINNVQTSLNFVSCGVAFREHYPELVDNWHADTR